MKEEHPGLRWLADMDQDQVAKEDLVGETGGKYTIHDVEPNDNNWLAKASKKVHAAKGASIWLGEQKW